MMRDLIEDLKEAVSSSVEKNDKITVYHSPRKWFSKKRPRPIFKVEGRFYEFSEGGVAFGLKGGWKRKDLLASVDRILVAKGWGLPDDPQDLKAATIVRKWNWTGTED